MSQQKEPQPPLDTAHPLHHPVIPLTSLLIALSGALAFGLLYAFLPENITLGPSWIPLVIECVLIIALIASWFIRRPFSPHVRRVLALVLLAVVTIALIIGVIELIVTLPKRTEAQADSLLRTAGSLWLANILVFALWYWEIDGGGPVVRQRNGHKAADFLFPQQADGNKQGWVPQFIDYLFLAFTGATALSPTDTYPLTRPAKLLMMIEALVALIVLAIIIGRAVNIL